MKMAKEKRKEKEQEKRQDERRERRAREEGNVYRITNYTFHLFLQMGIVDASNRDAHSKLAKILMRASR